MIRGQGDFARSFYLLICPLELWAPHMGNFLNWSDEPSKNIAQSNMVIMNKRELYEPDDNSMLLN